MPRHTTLRFAIATGALALLTAVGCAGRDQLRPPQAAPAAVTPPQAQVGSHSAEFSSPAAMAALAGIDFSLREVPLARLPGQVDSNSPAFWDGGELVLFNSAEQPVRSSGPSLEALADPVDVTCLGCERPGGRWLEAVWRDPASGLLYGWYHFEPSDLPCQTAPIVGAAISEDGGLTWQDQGSCSRTATPSTATTATASSSAAMATSMSSPTRSMGTSTSSSPTTPVRSASKGSASPAAPLPIGASRAPCSSTTRGRGASPAWRPRYPLFPSATGWKGPHVEAFWGPSVHWNDHLQAYVALLNRTAGMEWQQEGVYITFSPDLLRWSAPQKVLNSETWYPQVIGVGPQGTDTRAGQTPRLYVGGVSSFAIEFP